MKKINKKCVCGNPYYGFNCSCEWEKNNPGNILFSCEYCGIYKASKPICSECKSE